MSKKAIGITETGIELGFYKEDAPPTDADYISIGKTYKDTATLETAEGETVSCECEESDDPEDEAYIPGKTTLKYSTSDLDPATCHKVFGGTLVEGKWVAPESFKPNTVAVRFTSKSGIKVQIARGKMFSRINWAIKKNGYGLLEHTITKLSGDLSLTQPVAPAVPGNE